MKKKEMVTCAMCGKTEERTTPEDEMRSELEENFGAFPVEGCVIVCDDCYKEIMKARGS